MKVLILSTNTGGGHNSAAAAIAEELARRHIACDIEDCLMYLSERASELICKGHVAIYKFSPQLFGKAYAFEERHQTPFFYELMSLGVEKFNKALQQEQYDAIVCVHVFAAMLVTETQRRYSLHIPMYLVATDYTCSPGFAGVDATLWMTPDVSLHDEFVENGVPAERLLATGIPIRRDFYEPIDKADARCALGLPIDGRLVLVCCGSIGCGHINRIAPAFESQLPQDTRVVIICGNNERAYRQLIESSGDRTTAVAFTDKMPLYMAAADVCVSKPGGLSTTELMTVGTPMVLIHAVPGCETHNLDFVTGHDFGIGAEDWDEAITRTAALLNDEHRLEAMRQRLQSKPRQNSAVMIADTIMANVMERQL